MIRTVGEEGWGSGSGRKTVVDQTGQRQANRTDVHMADMFRDKYGDRDACFNALHELELRVIRAS